MPFKLILRDSYMLEVVLSLVVIFVLAKKRWMKRFWALSALLSVRVVSRLSLLIVLFYRKPLNISARQAILAYFTTQWVSAILENALIIVLIYTTFWAAMRPLEGIHNIGKVIFRWVSGVSIVFSLALALGPHAAASTYLATVTTRLSDGANILTLCLLLFVCFAIRPLGLTYRSRIFGISLGLGVMTAVDIVQSLWLASSGAQTLYSPIYLLGSAASVIGLAVWLTYFVIPEPERMMILLPTTSPFFFWNRVSEVLGDEPGFVAVGGIKPQMLAAAELKVMSSSQKSASAVEAAVDLGDDSALPSVAAR